MSDFMIRFFISNIFISGAICILLIMKRLFKNSLSGRMQYRLWLLLPILLCIPLLPLCQINLPQISPWFGHWKNAATHSAEATLSNVTAAPATTVNWMNDFTISINSNLPPFVGHLLFGIWMAGILLMILWIAKSSLRLRSIEKSALPLQNPGVCQIYQCCLTEMRIRKDIPIYSTAFLKSPIITGLWKPRIYLPLHLISEYNEPDIRYMLLHELQHYKHKDTLTNYLMLLTQTIYWFNPLIWYSLREMRTYREIACDAYVLEMLSEDEYAAYGDTLINFAEKLSKSPFPFAAGLGGSMSQMKRRIISIANYEKPTFTRKLKGTIAFLLTAVLLLELAPFLSTYAAEKEYSHQS